MEKETYDQLLGLQRLEKTNPKKILIIGANLCSEKVFLGALTTKISNDKRMSWKIFWLNTAMCLPNTDLTWNIIPN